MNTVLRNRIVAFAIALICLLPAVVSAYALTAGIVFGVMFSNPDRQLTSKLSKYLLQISVVGLGFGVELGTVLQEGQRSVFYTLITITLTMLAGMLLGKLLGVAKNTASLISFGTAICGGSAIAAMAPVIEARDEEVAVSLATVFVLNAVGLFIFPILGHSLGLGEHEFGTWAALAIHDTSSVVGAASTYGPAALTTAVTVKLSRALWIAPCVMAFAFRRRGKRSTALPIFIVGFVAAAGIRSYFPDYVTYWETLAFVGTRLLVLTLFLIGMGLTKDVLRKVGFRPLVHGLTLWVVVSIATLAAIASGIMK